jgi:hypothetical protein
MKLIIIFLDSSIILFNSCTKYDGSNSLPDQTRPPVANMTPDSLRGHEFVFDSLDWIDDDFGHPAFHLVDSNLFMPGRHISIAIKHDTASLWEQANFYFGGPGSWGYLYNVSVGVLAVWPNPAQPALIGKRFSLKVKYL